MLTHSRRTAAERDVLIDPWQAAADEHPSEQGGWLLSYLDVMTLLFSFFVMLFAYQKALTVASKTVPAQTAAATAPIPVSPAVVRVSKTVTAASGPAARPLQKAADAAPKAAAEIKVQPAYPVPAASAAGTNPLARQAEDAPAWTEPSGEPFPPVSGHGWIAEAGDAAASAAASLSRAFSDAEFDGAVEISAAGGEVRLEISDAILFDLASAELKPEGASALDRLAGVLGAQGGTIAVEGHTDDRPIATAKFQSNWELSTARASAVTRYLIAHGVPPGRLRAVGLADTQPREANDTPAGRARNRRVSIVMFLPREGGVRI
ncbi:OmpA family protein [Methylocaldum sp. MU1018]